MMRKIAIRKISGIWIYYISFLTYKEVDELVNIENEQLHNSKNLNKMIQRALTSNSESIKNYILNQREHFFNSLVLAVYDGEPMWREINLQREEEPYDMGFLEFNGEEKIFAVDGQHRVDGIKKVMEEDSEHFSNETIPVIFIGHRDTDEGRARTRRLFTALNKYAKPVAKSDIIALDEDNITAITTRFLIDNCTLFQNERAVYTSSSAMPKNNTRAFTNIISLNSCNEFLIKAYLDLNEVLVNDTRVTSKNYKQDKFKFRYDERYIDEITSWIKNVWDKIVVSEGLTNYITDDSEDSASAFRTTNGGNALFRPVFIKPYIEVLSYMLVQGNSLDFVLKKLKNVKKDLSSNLWKNIMWNPIEKKMITSDNKVEIVVILKILCGCELKEAETTKILMKYKNIENDENLTIDDVVGKIVAYNQ